MKIELGEYQETHNEKGSIKKYVRRVVTNHFIC